jgi:hypothetical protein
VKLDLRAPHQKYFQHNGRELTGVTTYLGVISKPHLTKWYANEERKGVLAAVACGQALPEAPFAEASRDDAADLGTIVHARIEAWLTGDELEPDGLPEELYAESVHGFERFREWWTTHGFSLVHSEYQLVYESETSSMAYGGTIDIVAVDPEGRVTIVDIKTTKKSYYWPYAETIAQVAAYETAYSRLGNRVDRCIALRVGKDRTDTVEAVELTDEHRKSGWDMFCDAFNLYESKRAVEDIERARKSKRRKK